MAIERPTYTVERREPPFEIRDYDATIVAVVHVEGTRSEAVNTGFRILAGYIFGDNQTNTKIAMTAPVTQTAGVKSSATVDDHVSTPGWNVRFTMPAAYTMDALPRPKDARVYLLATQRHRVAAMTFSGFWSDSNLASHEAQLSRWVQSQKLMPESVPSYAYYDPPWTPWFMRTIEVMVDVSRSSP